MRFNSDELCEFAASPGDHEGRLTHKAPPRTLYDTAYKERWFKLRANFLFYYRLNEFGGVDKNEPSGVFVLENMEVYREETADLPFGFAITWKDDPERKQMFFAKSEASAQTWISRIVNASYEHMRAQLIMLRVHIRRRTGKDPLEHCGTPLPQRAALALLAPPQGHTLSQSSENLSCSPPRRPPSASPHSAPGSPLVPTRPAPVPPPRKGRKHDAENIVGGHTRAVGRHKASFRSHLLDDTPLLD